MQVLARVAVALVVAVHSSQAFVPVGVSHRLCMPTLRSAARLAPARAGRVAGVRMSSADEIDFGKVGFDDGSSALNDQINVEYTASYAYHSLFAYFDRDTVALKGFAAFFAEQSKEERGHAEDFMKLQNIRGGTVKLKPVAVPEMQFSRVDGTSDALYAMELALQLEKFVYRKLKNLHKIGEECNDAQFTDKIEQYLDDQVISIKAMAEYVAQIRRVGTGHGVWDLDRVLADAVAP